MIVVHCHCNHLWIVKGTAARRSSLHEMSDLILLSNLISYLTDVSDAADVLTKAVLVVLPVSVNPHERGERLVTLIKAVIESQNHILPANTICALNEILSVPSVVQDLGRVVACVDRETTQVELAVKQCLRGSRHNERDTSCKAASKERCALWLPPTVMRVNRMRCLTLARVRMPMKVVGTMMMRM